VYGLHTRLDVDRNAVNTLDIDWLLRQRVDECGQFDEHFNVERRFARRRAQTRPAGQQANRAEWPSLTHIQVAASPLALEQHDQFLPAQRVERVGHNQ
jgi:hypothetical protein